MQTKLRKLAVQLYPRNLDVVDRSRQQQARQRVNLQVLGQRRPGARQPLLKQQRVLVNEAEWDKLGEAAGFRLDLAQQAHLAYPVSGRFRVSVHERGRGTNPAVVRGTDDINPL